ncbi:hypothetical protein Jab_2c08740 [Janthinobacterium sp. HH01]|uniref:helix-turn-helix domain-containing protein n=1 Tax=Janthinobacterium sp. HH01 TaxID=1198452 RepID=UPI0002AE7EA9|nr:helix-turn-helix transcriptional regulator [Janthinobacterium sp. HH01]ELX08815.1 hypothetical protein Jab_2c08740 [Janthinobacterium sp. HH01]
MTTSTYLGAAADARPHCLLDHVLLRQRLKNDAELSRRLLLAPSSISKIRRGRCGVSAEVMLRVHEAFDIPIAELKQLEAAHQAALRLHGA